MGYHVVAGCMNQKTVRINVTMGLQKETGVILMQLALKAHATEGHVTKGIVITPANVLIRL